MWVPFRRRKQVVVSVVRDVVQTSKGASFTLVATCVCKSAHGLDCCFAPQLGQGGVSRDAFRLTSTGNGHGGWSAAVCVWTSPKGLSWEDGDHIETLQFSLSDQLVDRVVTCTWFSSVVSRFGQVVLMCRPHVSWCSGHPCLLATDCWVVM